MTGRVCYVVNAVGETSVPADIATAVTRETEFAVDILAWFGTDSFRGDDIVAVRNLSAPNTTLGVNRRTYREARDYLREYDLVQAHHNHSGSFAKVLARRLSLPVVSREGNMRSGFTWKGRLLNGITNPLADRIVCNSRAVYESFTSWERSIVPDSKVTYIPNGVDLDELDRATSIEWSVHDIADIDPGSFLVGNAAMLIEQKAHDVLVEGIAKANRRHERSIELVVAGDGDRRSELTELAERLGVGGRVHFLGVLDRHRVYRMMDEVDVYAMPSRWEGFSAAAVEALGIGTACIFSDIPPFTEPYGGVARFHATDDSNALANRILEFEADEERRNEYAERGRRLVEHKYTMASVARQYGDLYCEIFSEGDQSRR